MKKIGALQMGVLSLAAATAIIHLVLAYSIAGEMGFMNSLPFIANGFGYLALAAALYLPQFKQWHGVIRWALIAFTAVTIIGWAMVGTRNAIGYIDKIIEVALIALLWIERRSL